MAHCKDGDMFISDRRRCEDFRYIDGRWQVTAIPGFWNYDEAVAYMNTHHIIEGEDYVQTEVIPLWLNFHVGPELCFRNDKHKWLPITEKKLSGIITHLLEEGESKKDFSHIVFRCQDIACSMGLIENEKLEFSVETLEGKEAHEELELTKNWYHLTENLYPTLNYRELARDAARVFMRLLKQVKK